MLEDTLARNAELADELQDEIASPTKICTLNLLSLDAQFPARLELEWSASSTLVDGKSILVEYYWQIEGADGPAAAWS